MPYSYFKSQFSVFSKCNLHFIASALWASTPKNNIMFVHLKTVFFLHGFIDTIHIVNIHVK